MLTKNCIGRSAAGGGDGAAGIRIFCVPPGQVDVVIDGFPCEPAAWTVTVAVDVAEPAVLVAVSV